MRNKETEAEKGQIGVSGHEYTCTYIGLRSLVVCVCILRVCLCMQKACLRIHTLKP